MKIITQHINPPIPARFWDWQAHIEGREENREVYGWGPTETAAVEDLTEAMYENCPLSELPEVQKAHAEYYASRALEQMVANDLDSRSNTR